MAKAAAACVLAAWERAEPVGGHERAVALLEEDALTLPLGQRDALLLRLYADVRGPVLDALATCPDCATTLEVHLPVADLIAAYPLGSSRMDRVEVDLESIVVCARCPTTADLIAVADRRSATDARAELLARCVESATRPDGSRATLDDDEVSRLGERLEQIDPLVDARIDIACAECGKAWSAFLDVPALAWAQVLGVARRILREVDVLARRYGWSEGEVLALSEHRRRTYLDLT